MRRVTRTGVIGVAVSGAMAVTMPVYADSVAGGVTTDSPGVGSGNTVQLPVHVPVNVCGNTVNVIGLLNPAMGNRCANTSGHAHRPGTGASNSGGATAGGVVHDSPGVVSGNGVQLPVDSPVNVSGNSANAVGIANPVFGNTSVNTSGDRPVHPVRPAHRGHPVRPTAPAPKPPMAHTPPTTVAKAPPAASSLAHTGADQTMPLLGGAAALVLGGMVLYRRSRPAGTR
ncbi:chaplin family protein [Streptomyces sp. NPDC047000]|uniref:chaplin n=1 Tax=Streptomyces sp. NPDC047000 TaxID=3155474 RepID=UPI003406FD24